MLPTFLLLKSIHPERNLSVFSYQNEDYLHNITSVLIDGEPWFVGKDVCNALEIKNVPDALTKLDEDEKLLSTIPISGQRRMVNLVSESGLYNLIFRSRKPDAKKFRKWVTSEVIPSIRKTGQYSVLENKTPRFTQRMIKNINRTSDGYFSIINAMYFHLHARFEAFGHIISDTAINGVELRPDISVGKGFANYISEYYPHLDGKHKYYGHEYLDGKIVRAREYAYNFYYSAFIEFLNNIWIPKCAQNYFKDRDPKALEYLPKLLD